MNGESAGKDIRWLHAIREWELRTALDAPGCAFRPPVLELGCGDGFLSQVLERRFGMVIATDLFAARFDPARRPRRLLLCNARQLPFRSDSFGIVFSAYMLEHLSEDGRRLALEEMARVLRRGGHVVLLLPTVPWKLASVGLYYLGAAKFSLAALRNRIRGRTAADGLFVSNETAAAAHDASLSDTVWRFLVPKAHGDFAGHRAELLAYRQCAWSRLFARSALRLVATQSLYAYSPYGLTGLALKRLRRWLGAHGLSAGRAYILVKE